MKHICQNIKTCFYHVKIAPNYHLWIIIFIIIILFTIYSAWPWSSLENYWYSIFPFYWLRDLAIVEFGSHIVCSLFIIPIIYSTIIFSWKGAVITWFLSSIMVMSIVTSLSNILAFMVSSLFFLLLPLLIALIFRVEMNWRKKQRDILRLNAIEQDTIRQAYILNIIEAQENERKYIAQNLHDDTIQTLLAVSKRIDSLKNHFYVKDQPSIIDSLSAIKSIILQSISDLRRLYLHLRPTALDDLGLLPSIRLLIEKINKESDINAQISVEGEEQRLQPQIEVHIYRVIQEALNNILYHSKATTALVSLHYSTESLKIKVADNGQGFIPNHKLNLGDKFGLIGMEQRIKSLGGTFQISSITNEGTQILIELKHKDCMKYLIMSNIIEVNH